MQKHLQICSARHYGSGWVEVYYFEGLREEVEGGPRAKEDRDQHQQACWHPARSGDGLAHTDHQAVRLLAMPSSAVALILLAAGLLHHLHVERACVEDASGGTIAVHYREDRVAGPHAPQGGAAQRKQLHKQQYVLTEFVPCQTTVRVRNYQELAFSQQ